jgi:hypothetical protein
VKWFSKQYRLNTGRPPVRFWRWLKSRQADGFVFVAAMLTLAIVLVSLFAGVRDTVHTVMDVTEAAGLAKGRVCRHVRRRYLPHWPFAGQASAPRGFCDSLATAFNETLCYPKDPRGN